MGLKEKVWTNNGNRMIVNSGNKTFDRQCELVTTGNVWSNSQWSSFVRPESEVECNGKTFPEGHLFDFDIDQFRRRQCPNHVIERVRELTRKHGSVILYQFQHWTGPSGQRNRIIHGWVVTDYNHNHLTTICANHRQKSMAVLTAVEPYICEDKN